MSIEVRELSFGYKDFRLSIDCLRLETCKVTSIVGRNGAGKSTFLKCLAGVVPVSKQSLFLDGRDLASLRMVERAKIISYVPQETTLALDYRVLDLVLMGRAAFISPFSVPSLRDLRTAEESLRFVGLEGFETRNFSELSGGERRLVLIARTLAQSAEILLLDEPTTFLDPKHEIEVMNLCRKLALDKGKTIIITLHNLETAVNCSDAVVFMKKGKVIAFGTPDEVLDPSLLEQVYDIPMAIVPHDGKKLIFR